MIRAPRRPLAPCRCGGTCRVCSDDLVAGLNEFRHTEPWRTADLRVGRRQPWPVQVPAAVSRAMLPPMPQRPMRAAPDVKAFDDDMGVLYERLGVGRG
jgi:hypothetical protein